MKRLFAKKKMVIILLALAGLVSISAGSLWYSCELYGGHVEGSLFKLEGVQCNYTSKVVNSKYGIPNLIAGEVANYCERIPAAKEWEKYISTTAFSYRCTTDRYSVLNVWMYPIHFLYDAYK